MKQFILYCIFGGIGVTTDYAVYYAALTSGIWYQAANIFGYVSGTVVSFFLNRAFTFNVRDNVTKRFALFLTVAAVGFTASAVMLWFLVDVAAVDAKIAKLMTLPVVVVIQFTMNRTITFRRSASCEPDANDGN